MSKLIFNGEVLSIDQTFNSGSTNGIANSAITLALDDKLDKQNYLNNKYPKGSVVTTTIYRNPSEWLGGTWELIGGSDSSKVYWPAFAIATDNGKEEVSESLPNIKGTFGSTGGGQGKPEVNQQSGAFKTAFAISSTYPQPSANSPNNPRGYEFNAASGSTVDGVYQDGAHVQVESIKLFYWERIDDALIIDAISALTIADTVESGNTDPVSSEAVFNALSGVTIGCDPTLDSGSTNPVANSAITLALDDKLDKQNLLNNIYPQGSIYITTSNTNPSSFLGGTWSLVNVNGKKTTLWSGSTTSGTISLSGSMDNYDLIEAVTYCAGQYTIDGIFSPEKLINDSYLVSDTWGGDQRYVVLENISADRTSLKVRAQGASLKEIIGINVGLEGAAQYVWERTDNASMIEAITPLEYSVIKDVLWSGSASTTNTTISLSGSMNDYDEIEFKAKINDSRYSLVTAESDEVQDNFMILHTAGAGGSGTRYAYITDFNADRTSFKYVTLDVTLIEVKGIKTTLIPSDRPYHSVKKLNPSVSLAWPTIQTDVVTEFWQETTGNHNRVYGTFKCKWTGGSHTQGNLLNVCTLANIPLPSDLVIGMGAYTVSSSGAYLPPVDTYMSSTGDVKAFSAYGDSNLSGKEIRLEINYEWDEI